MEELPQEELLCTLKGGEHTADLRNLILSKEVAMSHQVGKSKG